MGFCLITTSQNWNPTDYGLSVGDVITVVAVGGGAGGSWSSYNGGTGGTTSFGNYLTALGGRPHGTGQAFSCCGGLPVLDDSNHYISGGAGGGWLPERGANPCSGRDGLYSNLGQIGGVTQYIALYTPITLDDGGVSEGDTGAPASVNYKFTYGAPMFTNKTSRYFYAAVRAGSSGSAYCVWKCKASVRGGSNRVQSIIAECSGAGWGAGGAGHSTGDRAAEGGQIITRQIVLASSSPIACGIGGGGGGAYQHPDTAAYNNGENGSTGAGGINLPVSDYGNAYGNGGYGGSGDDYLGQYGAGGGASGCIGIFY